MPAHSPAASPRRLPPRLSVALELARAFGGLSLLPLRLLDFVVRREALAEELRADLGAAAEPTQQAAPRFRFPDRALRIFVSCAETSGEIHAVNLVTELRARARAEGASEPELSGLGGERLREAGVRTVGDPVARATMGLSGALAGLPYYLGLLEGAARALRGVDLAILVDSPALHVPLGRIARRAGARVVHFVAPQFWGWAPWRAGGYSRAVDRLLTILPFEPAWFARRGIAALHVGHPLLDAVPARPPPPEAPGRTALALLPGSRRGVVALNLPWMLRVARRLRERLPGLDVVLPHADPALGPLLREQAAAAGASDWARIELGDLHASLARSRAALSVSGTALIDLLHQRLPAVVVYRLRNALSMQLYRRLVVAPWFASPNLLAGREVLPEHAFHGAGPVEEVAGELERCLLDQEWRRGCLRGLELAARRLGPPGACGRAAQAALSLVAADSGAQ